MTIMKSQAAMKYQPADEDFASLFEESLKVSDVAEGSVVKGLVVSVINDIVTLDVGLKSEGRISLREFHRAGEPMELRAGDTIEVYIERIENRAGECVLSREKALREESWGKLETAHTEQTHVEGVIFGKVKGGFTVDLQGAIAFLPGSQVDIRPIKDIGPLMNIPQPFIILKMDRKRGNIVVSRRSVLEESRQGQRDELLSKIREGDTLEGVVKNITDYGAFIDMGGVDGLLHVTDISWSRINHPSEVFAIGDTIKVMVTKFDDETKRISLGMKQLEENPWKGVEEAYKVGLRFTGRVSNITDYGAFIELDKGIEGLVHVSEMSWTKKNVHPSKIIAVGQEVDVMVLDIDSQKHRISLGIKQCETNPWQAFADNQKESDVIEGTVRNITEFGLFVGLEGDIDGLVHHSDIKWGESGEEAVKEYKKGDTIKAKILLIDVEKERVSLGLKQLTEKPAGTVDEVKPASKDNSKVKKGTVVTVKVASVDKEGITVTLEDNTTGYIKKSELSRERKEQRPERFAVGDRVDAKIISTSASGEASLSVKSLENDLHKQAIDTFGSTDSGASLGDILGAALGQAEEKPKKKTTTSKSE
ncbi:MAG: 30S ribosomal protein S1 [Rickettsiales bacterium]|nr:30S ribosomal protein S1 [Rickettsiales bacterium]